MTEQNTEFSLGAFENDTRLTIRLLKTDVLGIERLITFAKKHAPEKELEIRREIRPIAVELVYAVIGSPQTIAEALNTIKEQEDENSDRN